MKRALIAAALALVPAALTLAALTLAACGQKPAAGLPFLDLEAAIDNPQPFDLTEIAESIEFIPLDDSRPEALIGRSILSLNESQDYLYVHDVGTSGPGPVKIFDRQGRYRNTVGRIGRGPGEFVNISQTAVDPATGNVYMSGFRSENRPSPGRNPMMAFDPSGGIVATADSVLGIMMVFAHDRLVTVNTYRTDIEPGEIIPLVSTHTPDFVPESVVSTPGRGIYAVVLPHPQSGMVYVTINGPIARYNGGELFIRDGRCDTVMVYRAGEGGRDPVLEPAFNFRLGSYLVPDGAYGEDASVQWSDRFRGVGDFMVADRYTIVRAMTFEPQTLTMGSEFLIFDRQGDPGGLSALKPDGKPGLTVGGINFVASYIRDGRLVGWLSALDIVDNAASITHPGLRNLAATLQEDSNPVIVMATLKN